MRIPERSTNVLVAYITSPKHIWFLTSEIEVSGQVFRFWYRVLGKAFHHQVHLILWISLNYLGEHVSPNSWVHSASVQSGQECQPYFDCGDQFLMKWRAAINFPSFPERFQKKLKDVQPSKPQFHGLLHWSGRLFSTAFFPASLFSFFSWVHRGVLLLFCYVSFDFCRLKTHRHFNNTKAQNVPDTENMWHISNSVCLTIEYIALDRVECH